MTPEQKNRADTWVINAYVLAFFALVLSHVLFGVP